MRVQYATGPCRSRIGKIGTIKGVMTLSQSCDVLWSDGFYGTYRSSSLRELTPKEQIVDNQIRDAAPQSTNPKDAIGRAKVDLSLIPAPALLHEAAAFMDGAAKYGPYNWRNNSVAAMVYIAACMRHINQWVSGEAAAADSLVHHLGHARACLGIILDAQAAGKLVDDRPPAIDVSAIMEAIVLARGVAQEKKQ